MWYLFSGTDFEKKRKAFETLLKRFSQHEVVTVPGEDISRDFFLERIGVKDLFGKSYAFVVRDSLEDLHHREMVCELLPLLEKSDNVFVFQETDLSAAARKPFGKKADHVFLFPSQEKEEDASGFSIFTLVDAFQSRNKKETWVLFQKALAESVAPIDIANMLTWGLKNIMLVFGTKGTQTEMESSGLKPFVFKKSLTASKKWDESVLKTALQDIVILYHDDRRGEDLARDLEIFLLKTLS